MPRYPLDDDDRPRPFDDGDEDVEDGDWVEGDEVYGDYEGDDGQEDEILTVQCLACGAEVIADVGKCPCCGEYLPEMVEAWRGKPWWWVVLGLMGIGVVIYLYSGVWML